jgi:hypothetical protein
VGDNGCVWVFNLHPFNGLLGEQDVGVATTWPESHLATGLLADPLAEVLVGDEKDFAVYRYFLDDLDGVATGANDVGKGLHPGRAIDISDDVQVGVFRLVGSELIGRAGVRKGATGFEVREVNGGRRVDDPGGLSHEVDPTKDYGAGIRLGRLVGEAKGVSHKVSHALDGFDLIIVGKDDCIVLLFEIKNFLLNSGEGGIVILINRAENQGCW